MATKWRFENGSERQGAAQVCARVHEELNDFIEEAEADISAGGDG